MNVVIIGGGAARFLADNHYNAPLIVDWIPDMTREHLRQSLEAEKNATPGKQLATLRMSNLPKNLWKALIERAGLMPTQVMRDLSKSALAKFCEFLKRDRYSMRGKTTHKDEFVTCGGVTLSEVSFTTMESKCCSHLYFCGEVLDIDGITGGFNFQNAWTTGCLAGSAIYS